MRVVKPRPCRAGHARRPVLAVMLAAMVLPVPGALAGPGGAAPGPGASSRLAQAGGQDKPAPPGPMPGGGQAPLPQMPGPIWLVLDGQQTGPYSAQQLATLARQGRLQPGTLAWHEGLQDWAPASNIAPLNALIRHLAPAPDIMAILAGSWSVAPFEERTEVEGFGDAVMAMKKMTMVFEPGGAMKTYVQQEISMKPYGQQIVIPITTDGSGTFTAEMFGPNTIRIKPRLNLTEYSRKAKQVEIKDSKAKQVEIKDSKGWKKKQWVWVDTVTTREDSEPMLLRIIDARTLQLDDGRVMRKE